MRSRKTRQLETIEEVLRNAARPLAIAELHAAAEKAIPGLGIATVYRTVKELTDERSIVGVTYAGQPTRYEWAVAKAHSHFICQECNRVFDIDAPEKLPLPKRKPRGFQFLGHEVIYYGRCADCHSKG
ncbi:MAG: Fur family transcriptional regulator [Opitutaceae bacterium]